MYTMKPTMIHCIIIFLANAALSILPGVIEYLVITGATQFNVLTTLPTSSSDVTLILSANSFASPLVCNTSTPESVVTLSMTL